MPPGKTRRNWASRPTARHRRAGACSIASLALLGILVPVSASAGSAKPTVGNLPPRLAPTTAGSRGPYVPDKAIVRFEPGASAEARRKARRAAGVDFDGTLGLPGAQVVSVDGPVKAAVRRLESQPGVAYAQPNYRYEAVALTEDTFSEELWGLDDPAMPNPGVSAAGAWKDNRGGGQVIAILDTGVDLTHPDLLGNLWENASPDPVDEDLHGFDFVDDDGDPDDYNFHGTHVAGTAAAIADNSEGIAGVAPKAEIMAVRVLDGDGSGSTADIAAGIEYAADHGADVINMSLGGPAGSGDEAMADAIEAAGAENDVVVVVAAGNEGADNDVEQTAESPCVLPEPNLICVAALSRSGALASFSNYGLESVDLAAPGTSILSAKPDYGVPLFSDAFDSGFPGPWTVLASDGGLPWGTSSSAVSAPQSATDSPAGDYGHAPSFSKTAKSDLFTTAPVDLSGERGCRLHFNTKYEIEPIFDVFLAGAVSESSPFDGVEFDGTSPGYPSSFTREEASVSGLDGLADVHPFFAVFSDEEVELDGAYIDDVRLFCRDETYVDGIATSGNYDRPESGNYVRFQGTSMATPHVAGVVALVRAAAPELDAVEAARAVLDGASEIPEVTPGKRTATEGIADACKAVALATGGNVAAECPASSEPTPQPPDKGGTEPPPVPVAPVTEAPIPFVPPAIPSGPGSDRVPPRTFFRARPAKAIVARRSSASAAFRFGSNERRVTFLCRVDRGRFRKCRARFVRQYQVGPHVLRVKARDAAGNTDATPAVYRFRVKA